MTKTNKRNIALYGGSFDPPHNGHVISVSHLLNSEKIDEVWLIPSGDSRYDKASVAKASDRLALLDILCRKVFHGDERLRVVDLQLGDELANSYTIDLVERFVAEVPDSSFYFVIGADNVAGLPTWKRFDELKSLVQFLIVPRLGEHYPSELPPYVEKLCDGELASFALSSSDLRVALKNQECVAGYMPEAIFQAIRERKLYC